MATVLPDLGTVWSEGVHAASTITFDRFDLHMIGRAGPGDYTSSRALVIDEEYMVTFEFDEQRFQELLRLLPKAGAAQLAKHLGGPFVEPSVVNIPPGAIVVGMRARLGEPRENQDERYVPLIVESVFPSGPVMSIEFEDPPRVTGKLELVEGAAGPAHAVAGIELHEGDVIDVWLKQEKDWVRGTYEPTTNSDTFERQFALLHTERTGMRPIFLGYDVRIPKT